MDATMPVMARDDLNAGPFILSLKMYNTLGARRTVIAHGRGFGYRIPHSVLHLTVKTAFRFFYKIVGITMEWKEFTPVFFQENANADVSDPALMTTFGWKAQAGLSEDGIGFIHKGYKRYVVRTGEAAEDCVKSLW
jgi:hypothetical protein